MSLLCCLDEIGMEMELKANESVWSFENYWESNISCDAEQLIWLKERSRYFKGEEWVIYLLLYWSCYDILLI